MRSALLAIAAFVLIPFGAVSSQAVHARTGDRIRITAPPLGLENQTARVVSVRVDSLFLQVVPAETLAVAIAGVTRLEMSTGRRRHALQGAGIGGLAGVAVGAWLGLTGGDDRRSFGRVTFTSEEKAVIYGVGLGVTGLVIGAIAGDLRVSERWTSVPLGSATATPAVRVGRGGARLAVSVSF